MDDSISKRQNNVIANPNGLLLGQIRILGHTHLKFVNVLDSELSLGGLRPRRLNVHSRVSMFACLPQILDIPFHDRELMF